ncbi:MAG: ATP-binding protein [Myxococcales bacterium]
MNLQDDKLAKQPQRRRSQSGETLTALPPATLDRMARSLVGTSSSSDVIKEHLAAIHEMVRAKSTFASLFEPEKGLLVLAGSRGRADETKLVASKPGEGTVGQAFSSATIVEGDDGHLAVPLVDASRAVGVLSVLGARIKATEAVWSAVAGHLVAALHVARLRDATVRRTRDLETALAGLKSLEQARDELLGSVSHALKSPLATIKLHVGQGLKERHGPITEEQRNSLLVCDRNCDRLHRLINDMLLMSKLQGERMTLDDKPFGLRALAQEAAGSRASLASAVNIAVDLPRASEVFVRGDRGRLLEAVAHLVENAILYNRPDGRVEITVGAEGGIALLQVKDTGTGIPPDDLPKIFDRFYRGHGTALLPSDSGLGLAIVRQVVHLHGGTVAVESAPGEGATFTVKLPLFAGEVSADSKVVEPRDGAILLVEDDTDCREVVAQVLESEGLSVVAAADSAAARELLAASKPALVLLDLRLGEGDGRRVLEHIRADARLANTPVFVISGAAESAAGFRYDGPERIDGFFEKPLNLPRLLDRIREVVRAAP